MGILLKRYVLWIQANRWIVLDLKKEIQDGGQCSGTKWMGGGGVVLIVKPQLKFAIS